MSLKKKFGNKILDSIAKSKSTSKPKLPIKPPKLDLEKTKKLFNEGVAEYCIYPESEMCKHAKRLANHTGGRRKKSISYKRKKTRSKKRKSSKRH
jgi:hypothetical protein